MRCAAFVVVVAGAGLSSAALGEQVVNGSFEDPPILTGFVPVNAGDTTITGWSVTSAPGTGVDLLNAVNLGDPGWAHDGVQSIDMSGTPGPGILHQDVATSAAQGYTLSFWVGSNNGPWTGALSVYWDGVFVDTVNAPAFGTWVNHTYSVVGGTGATTDLDFVSNIAGFQGATLDEVSVAEVPGPSVAALVVLAGAGAMGRRRR